MKLLPDSALFPTGREHYKDWAGLDSGSMAAVLAELARSQDHLFVVLAPNSSRAQHIADSLEFYLAGALQISGCRHRSGDAIFSDTFTADWDK